MVVVEHFYYLAWKRIPALWGSFRSPHLETLLADNAIMDIIFKSTAIILCYNIARVLAQDRSY